MWLPWEYGLLLAVAFAFAASQLAERRPPLASFAREATVISLLYSLWQIAGRLSLLGIDDAIDRAEWLWDLERTLRLPNELTLQNWMTPSSFWTQFSNLYYAIAHVPAMGIFLVWMFTRYRDQYPTWRNALAIVTGACLLIQLLPIAPPRLTLSTGMIDTGVAYGQSVYSALGYGTAGQLQAMPSIHVAWAAVIGWAVWSASTSKWRWSGPIHFAITFVVVALTGNHFWLDGIAAMILLVPARWVGAKIANMNTEKLATTSAAEQPAPAVNA